MNNLGIDLETAQQAKISRQLEVIGVAYTDGAGDCGLCPAERLNQRVFTFTQDVMAANRRNVR